MKTTFALPAAALGAILSLGACSSENTVAPASPPSAPSAVVGQATVGNLIAALNNVAVNIGQLNALNNLTIQDVQVVNVENVLNNARILENARFLNNIAILQNFLNGSLNNNNVEVLKNFLNNLNALNNNDVDILITDVIAIDVLSGGDVILFVR